MIPKFESLTEGVTKVIRRFMLTMVAALVATYSGFTLIHMEFGQDESLWARLLMTAVLGFLLFTVLQLWNERNGFELGRKRLLIVGAFLLLISYYLSLPTDFDMGTSAFMIRFLILLFSLLSAITFIPFVQSPREVNGFWHFNKTLFVRFFLTFVFTGSLYLGLILALVAARQLLGFDFSGKLFAEMWVVVAGLISTSFFLLGVPDKTAELEHKTDYSRWIRVFAEYILIPLLAIYGLILYVYTGKIIVLWNWPDGMVSWLVIVFSLGTILTNFLLFPLIKKEKWVRAFNRISFALVIPMTVVMSMAFKIRVDEYGITEPRYYGLVLCAWLILVALYFIFSKEKNYVYLPASVFIIAMLSFAGPLSSINVSTWSQMGRLKTVLTENGLLVNGQAEKGTKALSQKDAATVYGTLDYLVGVHGFSIVQPWFKDDLTALKDSSKCYKTQCVTELLGVTSAVDSIDTGYRSFGIDETEPMSIDGYKQILPFYLSYSDDGDDDLRFEGGGYQITVFQKSLQIEVSGTDKTKASILYMEPMLAKLDQSTVQLRSWNDLRIDSEKFGIVFRGLNYRQTESGGIDKIDAGNGYLLIK